TRIAVPTRARNHRTKPTAPARVRGELPRRSLFVPAEERREEAAARLLAAARRVTKRAGEFGDGFPSLREIALEAPHDGALELGRELEGLRGLAQRNGWLRE